MITYLPRKNQKLRSPIFLFPPNITFPSFPSSLLWLQKKRQRATFLTLNCSLNLTPCINMRAYELFLCKIWLCTHLGASLAQVGTELDFVPGGTWMHKMQYHRFRRTSTIVDDDVSYDDAAAAVIFFLLPSTQPHPPTKNCSGNIPKVVGNAVCCQRVRGPVLHRNSLPFPRCGFRPN